VTSVLPADKHAFEMTRARLAGRDMGEEDKESDSYDDTPPPSITGEYAAVYREAYREANPLVPVS
jgi:hypothetical protein